MRKFKTWFKNGKNAVVFAPVAVCLALILGVGSYFGVSLYSQYRQDMNREALRQEEEQRQIESSLLEEEEERIREEKERIREEEKAAAEAAEIEAMRHYLDRDTFFDGLYLNEIDLSGYTLTEAFDYFSEIEQDYRDQFGLQIHFEDQSLIIDEQNAGVSINWLDVIEQLWMLGREHDQDADDKTIRSQYERVLMLMEHPSYFTSSFYFDEQKVKNMILSFADDLTIEPVGAVATGFDTKNNKFILDDQRPGRSLNGEEILDQALTLLNNENFGQTLELKAETTYRGFDAATIQARTGFVSEARTYARAVNPGRDENIRLIAEMTNGMVLQPGETFSFNGYIGRRTAERGFREAGVIIGGVLVDQLGGGICQPNTTLFQAAAKAGLEIVERYPHSWPSTYTDVGIDATVSWSGPDFKFRNNTDYPVAIRSWYDKPAVVFQVYGRLFDEGVTVELDVKHHGYIPIPDPEIKETFNPDLKPGERVELRQPYIGQRTTAYRVFMKDGKEIKREAVAESYYRPLQGLVEYGPEPVVTEPEEPEDETDEDITDPDDADAETDEEETVEPSAESNETSDGDNSD